MMDFSVVMLAQLTILNNCVYLDKVTFLHFIAQHADQKGSRPTIFFLPFINLVKLLFFSAEKY